MTEERERKIKVFSIIENLSESGIPEGDAEKTEVISACRLTALDDALKIIYSEKTECGDVKSSILIYPDSVTIMRGGALVSDMHFEEGTRHKFIYSIPPYSFDAEIFTKKIRNSMTRDGGKLVILYTMKIGGQDKNVRMKIECTGDA